MIDKSRSLSDLPKRMLLGDKVADTNCSIADLFADHLSSVYEKSLLPASCFGYDSQSNDHPGFLSISVSQAEIHSGIDSMKYRFIAGPDGIPSFFIKKCVSSLVKPLHFLIYCHYPVVGSRPLGRMVFLM